MVFILGEQWNSSQHHLSHHRSSSRNHFSTTISSETEWPEASGKMRSSANSDSATNSTLGSSNRKSNIRNSIDNDLTQLNFSCAKYCGRAQEIGVLQDGYQRAATQSSFVKMMVRGYSGTGKSSLVQQLATSECAESGLFASGKFDRNRNTKPYSALSDALADLCTVILEHEDKVFVNRIQDAAQQAVGSEISNILEVVPQARVLLLDYDPDEDSIDRSLSSIPETLGKQEALNQLKYAFRSFLKAICTNEHPVVLLLDDLQWIDAASLDLLSALWTDKTIQNLLFVGAYRDNEVDDVHPLNLRLNSWKEEYNLEIGDIYIGNLAPQAIQEWIADLLKREEEEVKDLAELMTKRTHGNAFFVK